MVFGLPVLRAQITTAENQIIFSTEPGQIGDQASRIAEAGAGRRSELRFYENFNALSGPVENRQSVVSRLPLGPVEGEPQAYLQLDLDVTRQAADIERTTRNAMGLVAGAFVVLFALLYGFIQRTNRLLRTREPGLAVSPRIAEGDAQAERDVEAALKESEEQLKNLLKSSGVAVVESRLDGQFSTANSAFCEFLGYTAEEIASLQMDKISHPDDAQLVRDILDASQRGELDDLAAERRYALGYYQRLGSTRPRWPG